MEALAKKFAVVAGGLLLAASALGATTIGDTTADDVTLDSLDSDAFVFADGWNPHAGANGDTSGRSNRMKYAYSFSSPKLRALSNCV